MTTFTRRIIAFDRFVKMALTLTKKDKEVLQAFSEKKPGASQNLRSTGKSLDGLWMGGNGLASWSDAGKVEFHDLGSKAAQVVQNALKRILPKNQTATKKVAGRPEWFQRKTSSEIHGLPFEYGVRQSSTGRWSVFSSIERWDGMALDPSPATMEEAQERAAAMLRVFVAGLLQDVKNLE